MSAKAISSDFPFQSRFISVHGSKMHYIDEGEGDPILFLHGNPTSSYLWRNIIPYVTGSGRAVAPDLIGMGKSDKPPLAYRFLDHYKYLAAFIDELGLSNITLVLHDWGSGLGFHFAAENPDRVRAIAFMEAIIRPIKWSDFPPGFKRGFQMMRTPVLGWLMISLANGFVRQVLPQAVVRDLSAEEMRVYGEPYPTIASRKPVRQWPLEIPIEGNPADVVKIVGRYHQWLQQTDIPKLLLYAHPGGLLREDLVAWCRRHLPNLKTVDIGPGLHFVQEDNPHQIGAELAAWIQEFK